MSDGVIIALIICLTLILLAKLPKANDGTNNN